ncbi:MAG: hypothetical protein A2X86_13990 [Bdellovibrionales bacterium GWA2_49_15]|nr:MAG: hypothetical protein A2X86_13990 [Bdellovibrionales bacterium GWA2_49_15]HAZ12726.1 hypothetical protein [Bdellovibrionales bacterium]
MDSYNSLKSIWKKLAVKGQVKNYSSFEIWVVENDTYGRPIARILPPGFKTPKQVDVDAFKRIDGVSIDKHKNWWKFYDFSTVDVYSSGQRVFVSAISKTAVDELHFGKVEYKNEKWGEPLRVIVDVRKNKDNQLSEYYVTDVGWLDYEKTLEMACTHEIDNARPVFPKSGRPYIRSKRDKNTLNNFSQMRMV